MGDHSSRKRSREGYDDPYADSKRGRYDYSASNVSPYSESSKGYASNGYSASSQNGYPSSSNSHDSYGSHGHRDNSHYPGSYNRSSYGYGSNKDQPYRQLDSSYSGHVTQHTQKSAEVEEAERNYSGVGGFFSPDLNDEAALFDKPNTGINFDKYDYIHVEVEGRGAPAPVLQFDQAGLHSSLMSNIALAKYSKPTPVQKYSIPILLGNRDLMAAAQTGSGKTGGFLFPIIDGLLKDRVQTFIPRRGEMALPYAVILAPTRELAVQIFQECEKFIYKTPLKAACLFGGTELRKQARHIERGVDIVIATPGRLQDMYDRKWISFKGVRFLCLDEADRMLDMGFEPAIRSLVQESDMPGISGRRTMMFSATFPKPIQRLAADFLDEYLFLKVGPVGATSENITQRIKWVESRDKDNAVAEELKSIKGRTLIFVETKKTADYLFRILASQGFGCQSIHGDRSQYEREKALSDFKKGRINVLIATSVAARGLDIPNVEHVINYDLPNNIDDYVHRIGRTGRAGNVGLATAFFNGEDSGMAADLIEKLEEAKQDIPQWLIDEKRNHRASKSSGRGRYGGSGGGYRGGGARFGSGGYKSYGARSGYNPSGYPSSSAQSYTYPTSTPYTGSTAYSMPSSSSYSNGYTPAAAPSNPYTTPLPYYPSYGSTAGAASSTGTSNGTYSNGTSH